MDTIEEVSLLKGRVTVLEDAVKRLTETIVGNLDGKPGIISLLERSVESSKTNSAKLDAMSRELTEFKQEAKFDKGKMLGVVLGVTFILGLVYKFFVK